MNILYKMYLKYVFLKSMSASVTRMNEDGMNGNDELDIDGVREFSSKKQMKQQLSSISETSLVVSSISTKPGLSSLFSNDSGFKSEMHTTSSSSPSDKETSASHQDHQINSSNNQHNNGVSNGSSDESVPIMIDCHSTAATDLNASAATNGQVNGNERESLDKSETNLKSSPASSCEIKPIPIKKAIGEFVDEEKNLADGSSNFKPTGAVFKSISNNKSSTSPSSMRDLLLREY